MEKERLFVSEGLASAPPSWNLGMDIQSNELNCSPQVLQNCFLNPNWENSMDQSDPFESGLSSVVSSPVASAPVAIPGDSIAIRELIGRLGSICNSGDIFPQSYIAGGGGSGGHANTTHSANTSCYNTPLNSPPKLNLSMMDYQQQQIRAHFPSNHLPTHPSLAPFSTDPGFAERAARFSCFGTGNFSGLNDAEFPYRSTGKLSRVSSNQSFKAGGSQLGTQDGVSASDNKKLDKFSRSSTPDNAELADSREESSVSEQIPCGEIAPKGQNYANARKRKSIPRGKAKDVPSPPSAQHAKVALDREELSAKRSKLDEVIGGDKDAGKAKAEANGNQKQRKDNSKPPEPPKDYIHVRARRGQATDSHSLAERVRREKISERMKFLQDLVPGCNKMTGKAVMLDEIINYVQSLQRQVEFLSMKLATVNPRMEFNMEAFLSKDIFQSRGSPLPQAMYSVDSSALAFPFEYQPQQAPSLPNGIPNETETPFSATPLNAAARRTPTMSLLAIDRFGEAASQVSMFWEDDLNCVVQMGISQNPPLDSPGAIGAAQMKIEL